MNHDPRFPFPDEDPAGREWQAQERALADERAGLDAHAADPPLRTYRLMAHLLAQPPDEQLPHDFARRVARRAEQAARPAEGRLERNLLAWLVAAMALAGVAVVAKDGAAWLPSFDLGVAGAMLARPWLWALAACLGLSRLSRHWWPHADLTA